MLRASLLAIAVLAACSRPSRTAKPPTIPLADIVTARTAEAAYDAQHWAECADQWTQVATRSEGDEKAGAFYDAACCFALDGRVDAAVAALEAALDAGYWDVEHMVVDSDLASVRAHAKWPALEARARETFTAYEATLVDAPLRRELLARVAKDQAARDAVTGPTDEAGLARMREVDRENTAFLKQAVAKHGWPGKRVVGVDGANAAWFLAQHADLDLAFQKECLAKMEPLVAAGEVTAKDYAHLWDRVAVAEGRPQRWGTQFDGDEPAPIEDPANVDARRKEVGLPTLAEYKELLRKADPPK